MGCTQADQEAIGSEKCRQNPSDLPANTSRLALDHFTITEPWGENPPMVREADAGLELMAMGIAALIWKTPVGGVAGVEDLGGLVADGQGWSVYGS